MAFPAATASAKSLIKKLLFHSTPPKFSPLSFSTSTTIKATHRNKYKEIKRQKQKTELLVKRRTRSDRELDEDGFSKQFGNDNSAHVPVMLGEVLDVFASVPLKYFVDCTLGAGGHSSVTIQGHPEMKVYVGLDVDPVAHEMAQTRIRGVLHNDFGDLTSDLQVHTFMKNFRSIKSVLDGIDGGLLAPGVDGILMDLGMSSMQVNNAERGFSVLNDGPLDMRMNPQASLKAEDILNLWPDVEVGRILRDYGEESNWQEAVGGSSAPQDDPEEQKFDIKSILKDIEFLGSSHMTWKEKKDLENRKVVSLGGKPPKKQRLPLSVARVTMKKQKEREEKLLEERAVLGKFGTFIGSGSSKKTLERRRPEDRVLRTTEGNFRNGVLDVKHLLNSSTPRANNVGAGRFEFNEGMNIKGGKKGNGKKKGGGGKKRH